MKSNDLLKIDVNGVVSERQDIAKKDLCNLFEPLVNNLKVPVEIIVTPDFDQTIDNILKKNRDRNIGILPNVNRSLS